MRADSWLERLGGVDSRRTSWIGALLCLAVLATVVFVAVDADGREGTETLSNDGGAWLVHRGRGTIGHVNFRVAELSSAVRVSDPTAAFDVYQPNGQVIVHDPAAAALLVFDARTQVVSNSVAVPRTAQVHEFRGGVVVSAEEPFRLWSLSSSALLEVEAVDVMSPLFEGQEVPVFAVSDAGDVVVYDQADGSVTALDPVAPGARLWSVAVEEPVGQFAFDGRQPVALMGERLGRFTEGKVDFAELDVAPWLHAAAPTAQTDGTIAVVDADGSMRRIDTTSGESTTRGVAAGAGVVRPIDHRGCIVTVTHEPPTRWDQCGDQPPQPRPLDAAPGAVLRLRLVNGWVWINNVTNGELWFVDTNAELGKIDDWGAVLPEDADPDTENLDIADTNDAIEETFEDPDATGSELVPDDEFDEDGVNQPPVAIDDLEFATHVERPIVIDVVANDTDPDNDVLLIDELTNLSEADAQITATLDGTGVQVTPNPGYQGTVRFRYTISDGRGGTDSAIGEVDVVMRDGTQNRPPEAVSDVASITAGEKLRVNVLSNDYDPDGDIIVLVAATAPQGTIRFDPAGLVIFEPDSTSEEGRIELNYTVADEFGETAVGTIYAEIRLRESNQPPDARNDGGITIVGQPITLNLLQNDTDPDGDDLFVAQRPTLLEPAGYDVFTTISPDGEFVFIPDIAGTYQFSYAASDDESSDTARIRIEVRPVESNSPPVAVRDDVTIPLGESRIVYVLQNDGDPDGDVVGIVDTDVPPGAGLRIEPFFDIGFRVFVDGPGPAKRSFRYSISDGDSEPVGTEVVVAVADAASLNQAPVAEDDVRDMRAGTSLTIPVLDNDFDPEGGSLQVAAFSAPSTISVSMGPDRQSLRIEVPPGVTSVKEFPYDVVDEQGLRASALVKIRVVGDNESNQPPIARPDVARVAFEGEVLIAVINNDSDPEGDPIRVEAITAQPLAGTARVEVTTGEVLYRPAAGFSGTDRFRYSILDGFGARAEGEVLVGVLPDPVVNQDPIAIDDSYLTIATGEILELDVLVNDSDPDGDQIRIRSFDRPEVGDARLSTDGLAIVYTAPTNLAQDRQVLFGYSITDGSGGSDTAEITVVVQATPERADGTPIAVDDLVGPVRPGELQTINVVANDADPDGPLGELTVQVPDPRLRVEGQQVVFEAPAESENFGYQIVDVDGNVGAANIVVTVVEPQPPSAVNDSFGPVRAGETVTIPVLENDSDPDGDQADLRVVGVVGTDAVHDDQFVQVVAPLETEQYRYTIEDADGLQDSAVIDVIVAENRAPEVEEVRVETPFETPIEVDLSGRARDLDGDPLLYACCDSSRNGAVEVLIAGEGALRVRFTPDEGFDGDAAFAWQVDDQFGHIVSGTAIVTVLQQPNRQPTAIDGQVEVQVPRQGAPAIDATIDLEPLSDDPDGDDLSWSVAGEPGQNLTATLQGSVLRVVADDTAEAGSTSVSWSVTDPEGESATAQVQITVVEAQNEPPVARDGDVSLPAGNTETVDLDAFGSDPDVDDQLTFELTSVPSGSISASLTGDRVVTVNATVNASGENATVGYRVTDRLGESATGQISISVGEPDRPPPLAVDDSAETLQGESVDVPVLVNDTDPIGQGLVIVDGGSTTDGNVSTSGGVVTFSPEPSFFGTASFTYTIRDAADIPSREASAAVTVEVTGRPDQPSPPECAPESTLANLTWTTPTGNGAPIDAYELEHDQGGQQALGVANSFPWEGLTNGTEYRFRLRAQNVAGWSEWSDFSIACRPDTEPERPSPPQVAHGDRKLLVTWDAPVNEGSAIEEYELRIGGGNSQPSVDTEFEWTGLTNGTDYTFQVRARNLAGWSEWSSASAPEHPSTVPAAPVIAATTRGGLVGTDASGILQANWSPVPVADDGGDTIEYYEVQLRGGATIPEPGANASSKTWSGLQDGVQHEFRVRAWNRDGPGDWSQYSAPLQACTVPTAPTAVSAEAGDKQATVEFGAPSDDGGCPVSSYKVRIVGSTGSGTTVNSVTSVPMSGLTNGNSYAFEVRAKNELGNSPWAPSGVVIPKGLPICGSGVTSTAITNTAVSLQWGAANFNGGTPDGYQLRVNGGSWQTFAAGTQGTKSGLSQNTNYTFEIRAINEVGASPSCGSVTRLTCGSPPQAAAPSSSVNQTNNSFTATWSAVSIPCTSQSGVSSSYDVTRYEVDLDPGGDTNNGTSRTKTWSDLSPGSYRARVRACNAVGCGSWSTWSPSRTINPDVGNVSISLGTASPGGACWNRSDIVAAGGNPEDGCFNIRIVLSGWDGTQTVRCFSTMNYGLWKQFSSFTAGNGTHNRCSYSQAGRWVVVVVNGTVDGQPNHTISVPATAKASNICGQWPTYVAGESGSMLDC